MNVKRRAKCKTNALYFSMKRRGFFVPMGEIVRQCFDVVKTESK